MAQNRFKSASQEEEKPSKKRKAKSKKLSPKKWEQQFSKLKDFLKNDKTRQISGLVLIFFSACLLIAFTSFLFTWKVDQSKVEMDGYSGAIVDNWLGQVGASLSHLFIYEWFGIASYFFVIFFFLIGFRILFKVSLLPIKKTTKYGLFAMIWLSLFLGYFFQGDLFFLGGAAGYEMNEVLNATLGKVGNGILIFFILIIFFVSVFDISALIKSFKKDVDTIHQEEQDKFEELKEEVKEDNETLTDTESLNSEEPISLTLETNSEEQEEIPVEEDSSLDLSVMNESIEEDIKLDENSNEDSTLELSTEVTEDLTPDLSDGVSLEVEETEEEQLLADNEVNKKLEDFGEYDPTLDLSEYKMPNIDLLVDHGDGKIKVDKEELEANKNRIVNTLENYNIKIQSIKATIGPTVTLYEIIPAPGVRISKIKNLEDDIALSLAALGIRIIAPIPGKGTIGIEVPNQNPDVVSMRTVIASEKFQNAKFDLPVVMGKTIANEVFAFDLAKMPHLLMAGATGQGKSVGLNAVLTSLLYKKHPAQLKFVLVDPKKVELTLFNKIERHFLAKLPDTEDAIITDNQKVIHTLNSLCIEMDERYELLKNAFVRNIKEYNAKFIARKLNPENGHKYLPYIVLVIDEFADLIMTAGKEVETPIARLAQLARAIGIHLIIATQRPSTNIITGSIKANFPARIAFRVTTGIDSRTILDSGGAEQLIGRGDMLLSTGSDLVRLQCAFVDTPEVEEITEFIGNQRGYSDAFILPEYVDENAQQVGEIDKSDRDALFEDAARIIVQHQQGSASLLQRRLKLGYNRAGRIIDQLEAAGIIGPFEGSKARQVLIADEMSLEQLLNNEE